MEQHFAIEPADFGFFVLSVTVPLLLLWFILAYIERSSSLDANAELFQNYIENLLYPDETASRQARALAATLQEQTHLLQKENKTVIEQSAKIKTDLDARLAELSNILQLLDSYSAKTLTDLNDGVKTLADKCSYITDKTTNAVYNIRESSAEMAENASLFLSRINPLLDEISALSSNVKNNIADNKINLTEVKHQLEQSAEISQAHIDNMLAKAAENTLKIEQSFTKHLKNMTPYINAWTQAFQAWRDGLKSKKDLSALKPKFWTIIPNFWIISCQNTGKLYHKK